MACLIPEPVSPGQGNHLVVILAARELGLFGAELLTTAAVVFGFPIVVVRLLVLRGEEPTEGE